MLQHSSGVSTAVTHSLRTALAGAVAVTGPCCLGPTHTLTQVLSSLLGLDSAAGQPRRRSSVPFGHARGLCQCTCGVVPTAGQGAGKAGSCLLTQPAGKLLQAIATPCPWHHWASPAGPRHLGSSSRTLPGLARGGKEVSSPVSMSQRLREGVSPQQDTQSPASLLVGH